MNGQESASYPRRTGRPYLPAAAALAIAIAVAFYFAWSYGSVAGFVDAIDHSPALFADFAAYYYPTAREVLDSGMPEHGFPYTALFALALTPLGLLSAEHATWVWGGLQIAAIALLWASSARGLVPRSRWIPVVAFALCITSQPVLHNFRWGQVSLFAVLCVLGALQAEQRERPVLAGALLALGTCIKYWPALFALQLLWRRDRRGLASFASSLLALLVVLPMAVLGPRGWFDFHVETLSDVAAANWVVRDPNSQYFAHVVIRLSLWSGIARDPGVVLRVFQVIGTALGVCTWVLAWRWQRRDPRALAAPAVALFLGLLFFVRTSWPHYFVYLPFCQTVVLALAWRCERPRRGLVRASLALALASALASSVFVFDLFEDPLEYGAFGVLCLADLLLLGALLLLFGAHQKSFSAPA